MSHGVANLRKMVLELYQKNVPIYRVLLQKDVH